MTTSRSIAIAFLITRLLLYSFRSSLLRMSVHTPRSAQTSSNSPSPSQRKLHSLTEANMKIRNATNAPSLIMALIFFLYDFVQMRYSAYLTNSCNDQNYDFYHPNSILLCFISAASAYLTIGAE
ncbi:hypothetical protein ABD86_24200 [Paenibacillus alvei]|nr:hypothetical protein [Paenibacillus alvei]MBG9746851.1 hypothetical protein [Paenibacillus alvei]